MSKVQYSNTTRYFECACHSDEHTLKFVYDFEEQELYASIFLNEDRFWNRLINGIKYIFGYKCKYGHWNTWLFDKDDAHSLNIFFYITVLRNQNSFNPLLKSEVKKEL